MPQVVAEFVQTGVLLVLIGTIALQSKIIHNLMKTTYQHMKTCHKEQGTTGVETEPWY